MGGEIGMRLPTFALFIILSSGIFLMAGLLFLSTQSTLAHGNTALTTILNILAVGGIPFLAGMLVSWQLHHILRGIAVTLLVGLMGLSGAVILTFLFGPIS